MFTSGTRAEVQNGCDPSGALVFVVSYGKNPLDNRSP
jgi:hypothetical protein